MRDYGTERFPEALDEEVPSREGSAMEQSNIKCPTERLNSPTWSHSL